MEQQHKQALERIAASLEELSAEIKAIQAKEKSIFETTPSGTMSPAMIKVKRDQLLAFNDIRNNIDEAKSDIRFFVGLEA